MTDFDAFTLPLFLKILALKRGETLFPSEGQAGPWRSWRAEDGLHCFSSCIICVMHRPHVVSEQHVCHMGQGALFDAIHHRIQQESLSHRCANMTAVAAPMFHDPGCSMLYNASKILILSTLRH